MPFRADLSRRRRKILEEELRLKPRNLDLLVYTPRELKEVKERPFFHRALREAIVIYERKN